MAGLDGIKNKLDPGDPVDKNIYELPPEEAAKIKTVPGSLDAALAALEADHDFLLEGGVFTRTCWTPGSTTRRSGRSTPSGCARIRTNTTSTSTCRIQYSESSIQNSVA